MATPTQPEPDERSRQQPMAEARPASDLELTKAVADFSANFERRSRSLIAADGPSLSRLKLLYTLRCEGPQRMGELADALEVTPRSVTALVDGLEAQGQVRRVADPSDRRATIIEIVEGHNDIEDRYREHALAVARLFDGLDDRDRGCFVRTCRQITARLRERAGSDPDPSQRA